MWFNAVSLFSSYTLSRYESSTGLCEVGLREIDLPKRITRRGGQWSSVKPQMIDTRASDISWPFLSFSSIHCITIEIFASSSSVLHYLISKIHSYFYDHFALFTLNCAHGWCAIRWEWKIEPCINYHKILADCECNRHHRAGSIWTFRSPGLINYPGV